MIICGSLRRALLGQFGNKKNMTTKKKVGISDLLRDEVQKGSESAVNSAVNNEPVEKTIEVKAETVSDHVSQATGQSAKNAIAPSSKSAPISDDRDRAKISALESELGRSQQREADLQKDLKFITETIRA